MHLHPRLVFVGVKLVVEHEGDVHAAGVDPASGIDVGIAGVVVVDAGVFPHLAGHQVMHLAEGLDAAAERLLGEYEDDASATWRYNRALFLYRQEKSGKKARAHLQEALQYNPHVPAYLLGRKRLPKHLPPYVGFGDENEAVYYVVESGHLWVEQEGALDWLHRVSTES